jgi:hypothetical protein
MGIDDTRKGRSSLSLTCPDRIKLMLPTVVTTKFSVKEIIGIATVLTPRIAINAVYEDPPPKPTEE